MLKKGKQINNYVNLLETKKGLTLLPAKPFKCPLREGIS